MTYLKSVVAVLKKASLVGAFFMAMQTCGHAATTLCSDKSNQAKHTVESVVDGDTLRLKDGRSVRLIGINAPEMGGRGRVVEPYAVLSKRRLESLVKASAGKVALQFGVQSRDRYGRILAHVYDQHGVSLEAQLLSEGLAYHVVVAPNSALVDCFEEVESSARESRLGLWKHTSYTAAAQVNKGGFALLQGRIKSVQRNRGGVWLELGHSVTVNIPLNALHYFSEQNFERWKGRAIKTRGWISERRGQDKKFAKWRMIVSHPSMFEHD